MNDIEKATNPTIEETIKYLQGMIFPQDFSSRTLRAVAINKMCIQALQAQSELRWIPVAEMLPVENGRYITCDGKGNIHIFDYYTECIYPFFITPNDRHFYQPTHWMPLPEPPKGLEETK